MKEIHYKQIIAILAITVVVIVFQAGRLKDELNQAYKEQERYIKFLTKTNIVFMDISAVSNSLFIYDKKNVH